MQQQKWEIVQNVETLLLESGAGMIEYLMQFGFARETMTFLQSL